MFSLESVWPKRRAERVFVREINYLENYIVINISKRIDLESKNKVSCFLSFSVFSTSERVGPL
jgi:hypothetical protein